MSHVIGICMVKDEVDVIEATIRHMAEEGLDAIIVLDNGSTDGTREILEDLRARVTEWDVHAHFTLAVRDDPEVGYYQSRKMSELAENVGTLWGTGTWVVPFDADELWLADDRVGSVLREQSVTTTVATARLFNHFCTSIDLDDPNPFVSMQWRQRQAGALPKVAFRWRPGAVVHQGNHGVMMPRQPGDQTATDLLTLRHFPFRSAEHMVRKAINGAAAYRATNLPEHEGAHWRAYGAIVEQHGEEALKDVFRTHFWYLSPTDSGMVRDPAPWCRWSRS